MNTRKETQERCTQFPSLNGIFLVTLIFRGLHIYKSSRLHFHILHLLLIVSQGANKEVKGFPKKQGCSSYHLPQIKRKKCKINPKVGSFIKFKDLFQFFFLAWYHKKKRGKKIAGISKNKMLAKSTNNKGKSTMGNIPSNYIIIIGTSLHIIINNLPYLFEFSQYYRHWFK